MSAVIRRVRLYPTKDQQLSEGPVKSFTINQDTVTIDGENVRYRGHTPSMAREATIVCEANRWFVLFQTKQNRSKTRSTKAIGIDLGVKHLAITSDGTFYAHHESTHRLYGLLARYQGQVERRTPGSPRYIESKRLMERTQQRILTAQLDRFHEIANEVTSNARLIAIERFVIGPKIIANPRYYKAVTNARWDLLTHVMKKKARARGCIVVEVPPYYTSQDCSRCGFRVKKTLEMRWHDCPNCRIRLDRDINSALNIRQLGIDRIGRN